MCGGSCERPLCKVVVVRRSEACHDCCVVVVVIVVWNDERNEGY